MWSPYKLRSWVKIDKLNWNSLSENPYAINLLLQYPKRINWSALSRNESAIEILDKNPEKIDWFNLCQNPNAMTLLKRNKHKIHLQALTINTNPEVLEIINYFKKNKIIPNLLDSNVKFDKFVSAIYSPFDVDPLRLFIAESPAGFENNELTPFTVAPFDEDSAIFSLPCNINNCAPAAVPAVCVLTPNLPWCA